MRETPCIAHAYALYYDTPDAVAYRCADCGQLSLLAARYESLVALAVLLDDEESEGRVRARRKEQRDGR